LTLDDGASPLSRIVSGTSCKADVGTISISGFAAFAGRGDAIIAAPAPTRRLRRLIFAIVRLA
jgi:hypothetical protein